MYNGQQHGKSSYGILHGLPCVSAYGILFIPDVTFEPESPVSDSSCRNVEPYTAESESNTSPIAAAPARATRERYVQRLAPPHAVTVDDPEGEHVEVRNDRLDRAQDHATTRARQA